MTEQPPVQPPHKPSPPPAEGSSPATQSMPATASGSPAAPPPAVPPFAARKTNVWRETTSTRGGRWAIAIAAAAVAALMLVGIGVAGFVVLRHHDQFSPVGRDNGFMRGQDGQGNGRGPGGNGMHQPRAPGMPGAPGTREGRAQVPGGLGSLMAGGALHGNVTATVNGSVQALVFQRGEVTAVSATSITLKSTDGFAGTYGLNATTKANGAAPVKGGQAFVLARASDKVALRTLAMPAQKTQSN